jgi:hypothetical protein
MPDTPEAAVARSRARCTDEERLVLALETIADQMRLLVAVMKPIRVPEDTPTVDGRPDPSAAWENERGSLADQPAGSLGIKHTLIDQYEVGEYRYTKLDDAIAQAERSRDPRRH